MPIMSDFFKIFEIALGLSLVFCALWWIPSHRNKKEILMALFDFVVGSALAIIGFAELLS